MRQKKLQEKERLTENILMYGLWQFKEQVNEQLSKLKTKKQKVKALKAQLEGLRTKPILKRTFSLLPSSLNSYWWKLLVKIFVTFI